MHDTQSIGEQLAVAPLALLRTQLYCTKARRAVLYCTTGPTADSYRAVNHAITQYFHWEVGHASLALARQRERRGAATAAGLFTPGASIL